MVAQQGGDRGWARRLAGYAWRYPKDVILALGASLAGMAVMALVPLITVITCPSCEASYELEGGHGAADGSMVRCGACGHSWLEARALAVVEAAPEPPGDDFDLDEEASRIADAARRLAAERHARRRRRMSELRGWAVLAVAVLAPLGLAMIFPEQVVRAAPATVPGEWLASH